MATPAHCAYCFEILTADLEDREPLEYRQLLALWTQYEAVTKSKAITSEEGDEDEQDPDLQDGDNLEEDSEMDESEDVDGDQDSEDDEPSEDIAQPTPSRLPLPSISRLQVPSPVSASSSASTPSSLSTTSSNVALDSTSKSSSKTSFFSFGSRRSQQPSPAAPRKEEHPLFVTWNTISPRSGNKSLRGCIGTFEALELRAGLRSYALTAAFDDHRFAPVSLSELPTLSTSVTLLTNFTSASHPLDWTIGTHGIRISFSHHSKRYSSTYLPDVAVEQGWSKEETIVSLMRKAGWKGRSGEWRDVRGLGVVRYEGKKASLGWAEWKAWRDWVDGLKN